MMDLHAQLLVGNAYSDERGTLSFVNSFNPENCKRVYYVMHPNIDIVRAWQGHKHECKYFWAVKGAFRIGVVRIDNWESPAPDLFANEFTLSANHPAVLHIPAGFANGIKAIEPDSILAIFSDKSLEESNQDIFRFPSTNWLNW